MTGLTLTAPNVALPKCNPLARRTALVITGGPEKITSGPDTPVGPSARPRAQQKISPCAQHNSALQILRNELKALKINHFRPESVLNPRAAFCCASCARDAAPKVLNNAAEGCRASRLPSVCTGLATIATLKGFYSRPQHASPEISCAPQRPAHDPGFTPTVAEAQFHKPIFAPSALAGQEPPFFPGTTAKTHRHDRCQFHNLWNDVELFVELPRRTKRGP